jgi:hypothetical protein
MKRASRKKRVLLISVLLTLLLVISNLLMIGEAFSGYWDWVCPECGAELYHSKGKPITYSTIPASYKAHAHTWSVVRRPIRWSPWKPWHWFIYFDADPEFLAEPDPQELFYRTLPSEKYSDPAGLRILATDPAHALHEELQRRWADTPPLPE